MEVNDNPFGISGGNEYTGGGESFLFADSEPIKEEVSQEEKPGKEAQAFNLQELGPAIFDNSEEEENEEIEIPTAEVKDGLESEKEEDPLEELSDFENLATELTSLGIFTEIEGEEKPKTPEEFLLKWEKEKELAGTAWVNNFLGQFGPKHVDAFNKIFVSGLDPEVYYHKTGTIESIKNLDIEDESTQERIVAAYYRSLNWKEDKIQNKVSKLKDYDDLKGEAETAQEHLIAKEEQTLAEITKQTEIAQKQKVFQQQQYEQSLGTLLQEKIKVKEFNGLPINQKVASQLYDGMITKKFQIPATGEQLSEFQVFLADLTKPENIEQAAQVWLLKQNNFDFTKIKKQAVSKETNELFKSLHNKEKVTKRTSPTSAIQGFTFQ